MSTGCLFCNIVQGEMGGPPLYQDEYVTAFKDINPQAPVHILIVPNKHIVSLEEATAEDEAILGKVLLVAAKLARDEGVAATGYRLLTNTGPDAGQVVWHIHFHMLAGRKLNWPPG